MDCANPSLAPNLSLPAPELHEFNGRNGRRPKTQSERLATFSLVMTFVSETLKPEPSI